MYWGFQSGTYHTVQSCQTLVNKGPKKTWKNTYANEIVVMKNINVYLNKILRCHKIVVSSFAEYYLRRFIGSLQVFSLGNRTWVVSTRTPIGHWYAWKGNDLCRRAKFKKDDVWSRIVVSPSRRLAASLYQRQWWRLQVPYHATLDYVEHVIHTHHD